MNRPAYLESLRAQGLANAHAAVAVVREWGGAMERSQLRRQRLGRGADRATRTGLLVRQGSRYVLVEPLTANP
jgi:hypothetical protein